MGEMLQPIAILMSLFLGLEGLRIGARPGGLALLSCLFAYVVLSSALAVFFHRLRYGRLDPSRKLRDPSGAIELLLWNLLVFWSGWPEWVREVTRDIPVLPLLVGLLPFLFQRGLKTFWLAGVQSDQAPGVSGRAGAAVFQLRVLGLFLMPIIGLRAVTEAMRAIPSVALWSDAYPRLFELLSLILALSLVFSLSPLLIRFVIEARPLPAGPLRDRLMAYAERTRFRPSDILLWHTGRGVSNALYIGVWPKLRYIVLTDGLIQRMDASQIEAVYAHESGHGVRRHLVWNALLVLIVSLWVHALTIEIPWQLGRFLPQSLPSGLRNDLTIGFTLLAVVALFVAFFVVGIGWLSRRFETEADWHAGRTTRHRGDFARALTAVGLQVGVLGKRSGFRHFAIGKRLGLLNRLQHEARFRREFQSLMRRCRLTTLALLLIGLLLTLAQLPGEIAVGDARKALITAESLAKEGALESALLSFDEANRRAQRARAIDSRQDEFGFDLSVEALVQAIDTALRLGRGAFAAERVQELQAIDPSRIAADPIHTFNTELLTAQVEWYLRRRLVSTALSSLEHQLQNLLRRYPDADKTHEVTSDLKLLQRVESGRPFPPGAELEATPLLRAVIHLDRGESVPESLLTPLRDALDRNLYHAALFAQLFPDHEITADLKRPPE